MAGLIARDLVVDWCWVSSLSSSELLGVLACCSVVQRTTKSLVRISKGLDEEHTLHASASIAGLSAPLLRPACPRQSWLAHRPSVAEQAPAVRGVHDAWHSVLQICSFVSLEISPVLIAQRGKRKLAEPTFVPASPDCDLTALDRTSHSDGFPCSRGDPRWWRRWWIRNHSRCRHNCWMPLTVRKKQHQKW